MGVSNFDVIQANQYLGLPAGGGGASGEGTEESTGQTFYVCNSTTTQEDGVTGDDSNDGLSPLTPLATIGRAHTLATAARGDRAHVMPNHAETLTAVLTISKAGFNIIGHGQGTSRPQITVNYVGDGISVTGANVEIAGLYFNESTAAATANINVAAANCRIHDCRFDLGATDLECITWASGAGLEVYQNEFVTTANGPDAGVEIEAANDGGKFYGNIFNGGSATNAWDAAAINSVEAHTNAYIDSNVFQYGTAHITATSVSTTIGSNNIYSLGVSSPAAPHGYYTDLGTTIRDGLSPDAPTTLNDALVTKATAGDTVLVLAGSTSSPTTSQAMSVAGVKLIGLGERRNRPAITPNGTVDIIDVTGANCTIENLVFLAATAVVTADINVGAADVKIKNCEFLAGASNTNAVITIPDAGDRAIIEGNEFLVTANGPTIGISIESASTDGVKILKNEFNGGSTTNQWDTAAINSSVAHTNCTIDDNMFLYGTSLVVATSVSTYVGNGNKYGIGAVPNAATPITLWTDNGTTVRDGLSPTTPTTVANAFTKTRTGVGDTVLALPGTYTITAAIAISNAAVRFGPAVDNGTFNVTITTASDVDLITLTGGNCEIWGLRFLGNAAMVTTPSMIDADTGDFNHIHDCFFDSASVAALDGINIASTATDFTVKGNYFTGGVATVGYIVDLGARTKVLGNYFNQIAADSYAINNDGLATGGAMYVGNYILGDGGANAAMCLFDSTAPVQFLCAANLFAGTTSATPFGQDAEWTTMFVENYVADNSGGVKIDPVV